MFCLAWVWKVQVYEDEAAGAIMMGSKDEDGMKSEKEGTGRRSRWTDVQMQDF